MKKRSDFQKVRETGRSKVGRFLVLSTLEDSTLPPLMVAFITTKKIGKAHDRNLVRRRLRSIVQHDLARITDPLRYLVLIARYNAVSASFSELQQDWAKLTARVGLCTPPANSPA
jgi:ribonuclease P protein component